jgi:hypothetical protein
MDLTQNKKIPFLPIIITALIALLYRLSIVLNQSPEFVIGETNNLWNAFKVIEGSSIYTDPESYPFEILQYTPLSQFPIYMIAWIERNLLLTNDFTFTLALGRLTSLAFNVFSAFLVHRMSRKHLKISSLFSFIGSVIFFCFLPHHVFAIRPDSMALFLSILGIFYFSYAYFMNFQKSYILSGVILALSFFAKQDAFLISGALGLILLFNKEYKNTLLFSASFLVSFGIFMLLFKFFLGYYFLKSIFGGIALEMKWEQFSYILTRYITFYFHILIAVVISIFYMIKLSQVELKNKIFLITALIFSLLVTFLTSSKVGSHINYYILPTLFAVMIVVLNFDLISLNRSNSLNNQYLFSFSGALICLYFLFFQYYHYTSYSSKFEKSISEHQNYIDENQTILNEVRKTNQNVVSYDSISKLLLSNQIILPNLEFYWVSNFSYDKFKDVKNNKHVEFIIMPLGGTIPSSYFSKFGINVQEYKKWYKSNQIEIYRNEYR